MTTAAGESATGQQAPQKRLKIGIIGCGVGAAEILPAMESMDKVELVAAADVNARVLETFHNRYPWTKTYDSAEKLCADPDVEAVWIATPNKYHGPQAVLAANHGKHVVVEKPMAMSLQEAERMVEAADKSGVALVAGHTFGFTPPIRQMRRIIKSGELGKLQAVNAWSYSDWMLRPRTGEEIDLNEGGGLVYRQTPHQVDTIRLLGGGMLRSVRGGYGDWGPRDCPGFYVAYLEFEDGTPSIITHNGYGYFLAQELVAWGNSTGRYTMEERASIRRALSNNSRDEESAKDALRIGGADEERVFRRQAHERRPWLPSDLGVVVVTCEAGDIRHSPYGVFVYGNEGTRDEPIEEGPYRQEELQELYGAAVEGKPVYHNGRWGMATLEVTLAIIESQQRREEIYLSHQVPMREDYD